ncbi:MAG: hypothetical protein IKR23_02910 [Lachnospiraceae bacterium]|nr:hypothetical protein [Lachnospiraceae bacterium]
MDRVNSKLESIIEQMEQLIEQSKPVFLSSTNISVDRERLEDLVKQFKNNLPEEIDKYRRLLSNADIVEQDARDKADKLIAAVHQQASELISESEITSRANKQADDIVAAAGAEADRILTQARFEADGYLASAQAYLNDMLINLNNIIVDCLDSTTRNTNRFLDSLSVVNQTVQDNLAELNAQPEMPPQEEMPPVMTEAEPPSIFDNPEDGSMQ